DHAYGLYLWHWPLLIFYMELRDRDAIGWRGALVILAVTVVLAMLTYQYIEQPLKARQSHRTATRSHRVNKLVVATAAGSLLITGTGTTLVLNQHSSPSGTTFTNLDSAIYPGARQHFKDDEPPEAE